SGTGKRRVGHAHILHERTRCATRSAQCGTAKRARHAAGTRRTGDNSGRSPRCHPISAWPRRVLPRAQESALQGRRRALLLEEEPSRVPCAGNPGRPGTYSDSRQRNRTPGVSNDAALRWINSVLMTRSRSSANPRMALSLPKEAVMAFLRVPGPPASAFATTTLPTYALNSCSSQRHTIAVSLAWI